MEGMDGTASEGAVLVWWIAGYGHEALVLMRGVGSLYLGDLFPTNFSDDNDDYDENCINKRDE